MLETDELLILPLGADGVRPILGAADRALLGHAVWRDGGGPWWWPGASELAVHEADDAPLLFTLQRRWGLPSRRVIRDAEGECVGDLVGGTARDQYGRRLAVQVRQPPLIRWVDADGATLAEIRPQGAETYLRFAPAIGDNPFLRMVLLAAGLGE